MTSSSPWTRVTLQECHHEVKQDDDQRLRIVQQILPKSTLPRVEHRVSGRTRRGHICRTCAHTAIDLRLKTTSGASLQGSERSSATGGVRHVVASATGETGRESWPYSTVPTPARRRCFGPTPRRTVRVRILRALSSFSANQQTGGCILAQVLVEGFQEQSRLKIVDEPWRGHQDGQP